MVQAVSYLDIRRRSLRNYQSRQQAKRGSEEMNRQERAKLERAVKAGHEARKALDQDKRERDNKKNKKLIGTCWRFLNGYNPDERWWLYAKVTGTEDGWLRVFRFEKTSDGKIEIASDVYRSLEDYRPIAPAMFNQVWLELKAEIETLG